MCGVLARQVRMRASRQQCVGIASDEWVYVGMLQKCLVLLLHARSSLVRIETLREHLQI